MKLWILNCGTVQADAAFVKSGANCATLSNPNPGHTLSNLVFISVLIEHPSGLILFDTGPGPDLQKRWGNLTQVFMPVEERSLLSELDKTGHKPEDITAVIISHLHLDHVGGLEYFKCPIYVHQKEIEHAFGCVAMKTDPAVYLAGDLTFAHEWKGLDFETSFEFLPGIKLHRAPGHTPGMIMMEVQLSEKWLFTSDLYHIKENFEGTPQGWLMRDYDAWQKSHALVQRMLQGSKWNVVLGHCPQVLAEFKTAPHSYN